MSQDEILSQSFLPPDSEHTEEEILQELEESPQQTLDRVIEESGLEKSLSQIDLFNGLNCDQLLELLNQSFQIESQMTRLQIQNGQSTQILEEIASRQIYCKNIGSPQLACTVTYYEVKESENRMIYTIFNPNFLKALTPNRENHSQNKINVYTTSQTPEALEAAEIFTSFAETILPDCTSDNLGVIKALATFLLSRPQSYTNPESFQTDPLAVAQIPVTSPSNSQFYLEIFLAQSGPQKEGRIVNFSIAPITNQPSNPPSFQ